MNAVIYARFSSSSQREASIDQQIAVCTTYADRMGYTVLQTYSDRAITGRTDQRPEFLRMIQDASKGRFQAVIVYAIDRFSRDKYDSARYKHDLAINGVRVVSATEPITDTPSGILVESVFEGLAQYYSAELSQKIRRGNEDNARKCLASGSVPFGYRRSKDGHYEVIPEEAEIVREIFSRAAAGETYADIARSLNERGIKTKHGANWNRSSFKSIIGNQRYIGTYISKYNIQENSIPQIVSKEVFYKVQKPTNRKRGPRKTPNGYYCLTGKLYCGLCGERMTGVSGTSATGKLCFYYTCHGHRAHKCDQRSFPRDKLEEAIYNAIKDDVLSDDAIRWMAHQTILDQEKLIADQDVDLIRASLAQAKAQKRNIIEAIKEGIFTSSTKDELLQLEQKEADLTAQLKEAEAYISDLPTEEDLISYMEIFREGCGTKELTITTVMDAFVKRVEAHKDYLLIYFRIKKEDRQKTTDLPAPDECSFSATMWRCENPKRTLYFTEGYFILQMHAA